MISGLPNMAYTFGYFRNSGRCASTWFSHSVGRLLTTMQDKGATMAFRTLRPQDADMQRRPWSDPENINSGYVMRSQHIMFKQGDREPWTHMLSTTRSARSCPRPTSMTGRSSTASPARSRPQGQCDPLGGDPVDLCADRRATRPSTWPVPGRDALGDNRGLEVGQCDPPLQAVQVGALRGVSLGQVGAGTR